MKRFLFILIAALFAFNGFAFSQTETLPSEKSAEEKNLSPVFPLEELIPEPTKEDNKFFGELLNMLASLGLIIALILLVAWFLKRYVNTRLEQMNSSSGIKVVERRALSPKTMLYLLQVQDKTVLIAESANGVARLTEYVSPPSEDTETESTNKPSSFGKLLEGQRPK